MLRPTVLYPVFVRSRRSLRPALQSVDLLWLVVAGGLVTLTVAVVGWLGLQLWPPGLALSLPNGSREVPLDSVVLSVPEGWASQVEQASLRPAGGGAEAPARVEWLHQSWLPGQSEAALRPASGALLPDTEYLLRVRASALSPALPLPRRETVEREIRFSTPPSPHPLAATAPIQLRWDEPLAIDWSIPVGQVRYEVSPPLASHAWIDADGKTSFLALESPEEAASYRVIVTEAVGLNGIPLQRPASYTVVAPARPRLLEAPESTTIQIGLPFALQWSEPLKDLRLAISPEAELDWSVNPDEPSTVEVRLGALAQGERYELTVRDAVAQNGAPLAEPQTLALETPPALEVSEFLSGGSWALTTTRPTIVFSEPIINRLAAEAAIEIEPAVAGRFEWPDDSTVRFVPNRPLPYGTSFTLSLQPGLDGARSVQGGYLDEDAAFSFRTVPNQTIDVNVTSQTMMLLEGDQVVRNFVVSTGLPGADTPIGQFRVQYKMPTAHFRGFNSVTGRSYDLPNVKWVLAFMGDYTIHGAYWRQAFGAPGSNGCVSLTDGDAQAVYAWATPGTLINIHY
jgi:lipoprotein-anchoring transpeptidase ErfK/SrfK